MAVFYFNGIYRRFSSFRRNIRAVLLLVLGACLLLYYDSNSLFQFQRRLIYYADCDNDSALNPKTILLWTPWFGDDQWQEIFDANQGSPFVSFDGPLDRYGVNNIRTKDNKFKCFLTSNRSLLNEASAIVVHGRDFNESENFDTILQRQAWQRLVFFLIESPFNSDMHTKWEVASKLGFNWTMTYWRKSDVPYFYGTIRRRDKALSNEKQRWIESKIKKLVKRFPKRLWDAVWFVSSCWSPSHREQLVQQMNVAGLDIDVYGVCSFKNSPKWNHTICGDCADMNMFRYYLALENSLCEDYLTEKVFNAYFNSFTYGLIPVIYAGDGLSEILPYGSYIDVRGMSPEKLVDFLQELAKSPDRIAKYFDWFYTHQIDHMIDERGKFRRSYFHKMGWSSLCERLWTAPSNEIRQINDLPGALSPCQEVGNLPVNLAAPPVNLPVVRLEVRLSDLISSDRNEQKSYRIFPNSVN